MKIVRRAAAHWAGTGKEGKGSVSTDSKILDNTPYDFGRRFGDTPGTNPEELIAAAHASCYCMATSFAINKAGFTADSLDGTATLTMEQSPDGFTITAVHLTLVAKVPGMSEAQFMEAATLAKNTCPISKVLNATITLDAKLAA